MLNNLFKLYLKNTSKTPLEDFTTEAFAGILRFDNIILNDFVKFINIPANEYSVKTQVKYALLGDNDCIVDLVLESKKNICFIENKVNSSEGHRQLERYCKVLDSYNKEDYDTSLIYCTKYYEKKTFIAHQFNQIRWFQIAKFLRSYSKNPLVKDFISFLKSHNMAQELTITTKDLLSIENLFNTLNILKGYLDRVKPVFSETFISSGNVSDGCTVSQIMQHKRVIYHYQNILGSGYSEIKYGIQTSSSQMYVSIWIDKSNSDFNQFKKFFSNKDFGFIIIHHQKGIAVELKEPLQKFINNENADTEILNWFKSSFSKFSNLIKQMKHLSWKINVA